MNTDILIIGSGIAGLYTAINIDSKYNILVITKNDIRNCNSYLAQGGISVARDENDYELFIQDTLTAGGYSNNLKTLNILVRESIQNINKLIDLGVIFDMDNKGFKYNKEGAHSINRILHCKDRTGEYVHETLIKCCSNKDNIKILEYCRIDDLLIDNNRCVGASAVNSSNEKLQIYSNFTILATGGIGGIFKSTTNCNSLKGDGIELALRNGVKITDLDKIQFHPTALYEKNKKEKLLISEAVRGAGATLTNTNGERFVDELMPRDKVTKAIHNELNKNGDEFVFLNMTHMKEAYIKDNFPFIYEECIKRHIDITKQPIPVLPAQHYIMGGVKVDEYSKTSTNNLYAVGEVSCTGVHGDNRLASNSLLEALVFSKRAADDINNSIIKTEEKNLKTVSNNIIIEESKETNLLIKKIISLREDLINELCNY